MYYCAWIDKSKKNLNSFRTLELNKLILKNLLSNKTFKNLQRFHFFNVLNRYNKNLSISNYRRYCILSRQARAVFRFFKLSRHFTKRLSSDGFLPGMRKSSF